MAARDRKTALSTHLKHAILTTALRPGADLDEAAICAEFDLSRTELKDVEPFRLLAGCLRGNRPLPHVKLNNMKMEVLATLAHGGLLRRPRHLPQSCV